MSRFSNILFACFNRVCVCVCTLFLFQSNNLGSKYELASVQSGGYLKIHQIDSVRDSGMYTCIVRNRGGDDARREIKLNVNSKIDSC